MRVTKLEHATLVLEAGGKTVVIDPGAFTTPVTDPGSVVAVIVTHEHPDHWTPEQLKLIRGKAGDIPVFGPKGFAKAAGDLDVTVVADGDEHQVGPFALRFFGERHAVIHETLPVPDNVGVLVDGELFYPGDAFTEPGVEIGTLAVPSSAPWLKLGESMDYLEAVKPKRAFPTHDAILSTVGRTLHNARLAEAAERAGAEYFALEPGQTLDI